MRTNKLVVISATLFALAQAVWADGITVPGGGSTSNIGGSTCGFDATGLNTCPIGATTASTGVFSSLNGTAITGVTGSGKIVLDTNAVISGFSSANFANIGSLSTTGVIWTKVTAPTVASGFGTSPTIPFGKGPHSFSVNVGTGGSATSGVLTLPAATNEWNCSVTPFNPSAAQLLNTTIVSARSTTSITLTNEVTSTGVAAAWPASQVLMIICGGA